jgi:hypothetical protein
MEYAEKMMKNQPRLPIGIQSFQEMRAGGYAYVDKTTFFPELLRYKYYFLSRPRRFGKSLLIDTLDCLFSGRKDLFKGLSIEPDWNWSLTNPVLRLDWSQESIADTDDLKSALTVMFESWADRYGLTLKGASFGKTFTSLVADIHSSTGKQVVVLVDEYDKPILDNLENRKQAEEIREALKGFYGLLKSLDIHLRFVLLTGVSKFAKAGIFSGLNNLNDISIDSRYSALCGYTQQELETVFAGYLSNFDAGEVRNWYNGYSWTGERVYNPFDVLLLFDKGTFRSWWFETGTPEFLVTLWKSRPRPLPDLEALTATEDLLGSFDLDSLSFEALLFQSGYLTITDFTSSSELGTFFTLGFPNREVRQSFNILLLTRALSAEASDLPGQRVALQEVIESADPVKLETWLRAFIASIPYHWYTKNRIAEFEGYYASLIYALLAGLGYDIVPEEATFRGRSDITLRHRKAIWVMEIKVSGLEEERRIPGYDITPLEQIKEKGYGEKYRDMGIPVYLVGMIFGRKTRELESFTWERLG